MKSKKMLKLKLKKKTTKGANYNNNFVDVDLAYYLELLYQISFDFEKRSARKQKLQHVIYHLIEKIILYSKVYKFVNNGNNMVKINGIDLLEQIVGGAHIIFIPVKNSYYQNLRDSPNKIKKQKTNSYVKKARPFMEIISLISGSDDILSCSSGLLGCSGSEDLENIWTDHIDGKVEGLELIKSSYIPQSSHYVSQLRYNYQIRGEFGNILCSDMKTIKQAILLMGTLDLNEFYKENKFNWSKKLIETINCDNDDIRLFWFQFENNSMKSIRDAIGHISDYGIHKYTKKQISACGRSVHSEKYNSLDGIERGPLIVMFDPSSHKLF